jgi:hypothetical protein
MIGFVPRSKPVTLANHYQRSKPVGKTQQESDDDIVANLQEWPWTKIHSFRVASETLTQGQDIGATWGAIELIHLVSRPAYRPEPIVQIYRRVSIVEHEQAQKVPRE